MKLYLWKDLDQVSGRYHSEGGVVIVAYDRQHAEEQIRQHNDSAKDKWQTTDVLVISDEDWGKAVVYDLAEDADAALYVFPDAGCC